MSVTGLQSQAFSSSDEGAIERTLNVSREDTPSPATTEFYAYYEIERTVQIIQKGDYKRIALQFPDELLHDSVPVYRALQESLGPQREAYVLADTSYGSCCVDEVAASHVDADVLVHYGHACLSQTSRLPVIYVFGRKRLNVEECVDKISAYLEGTITTGHAQDINILHLRHDVGFAHLSDDLFRLLRLATKERYHIEYEPLPEQTMPMSSHSSLNQHALSSDDSDQDTHLSGLKRKILVWVGEESTTLTKLLMTSSGSSVISYSPRSGTVQEQTHMTNRLLMRRYAILQKARDADVFGILIGTLGVSSYLPLVQHLRQLLRKAHKKSYTVSVGKINPAKLANFMEIECWVWVACSEGMVDSKDYLRPIITPFELELVLQPEPEWTGKYIFDFEELLSKVTLDEDSEDGKEDGGTDLDQPMFSLVSGKYRQPKRYGDSSKRNQNAAEFSQELTVRSQDSALSKMADSAAAQFLHARSYQGLDPRLGQDTPSILEQGRSGIARGYKDDRRDEPRLNES
ncbi:DPH2 [Sanghuangporus vaninii]